MREAGQGSFQRQAKRAAYTEGADTKAQRGLARREREYLIRDDTDVARAATTQESLSDPQRARDTPGRGSPLNILTAFGTRRPPPPSVAISPQAFSGTQDTAVRTAMGNWCPAQPVDEQGSDSENPDIELWETHARVRMDWPAHESPYTCPMCGAEWHRLSDQAVPQRSDEL